MRLHPLSLLGPCWLIFVGNAQLKPLSIDFAWCDSLTICLGGDSWGTENRSSSGGNWYSWEWYLSKSTLHPSARPHVIAAKKKPGNHRIKFVNCALSSLYCQCSMDVDIRVYILYCLSKTFIMFWIIGVTSAFGRSRLRNCIEYKVNLTNSSNGIQNERKTGASWWYR